MATPNRKGVWEMQCLCVGRKKKQMSASGFQLSGLKNSILNAVVIHPPPQHWGMLTGDASSIRRVIYGCYIHRYIPSICEASPQIFDQITKLMDGCWKGVLTIWNLPGSIRERELRQGCQLEGDGHHPREPGCVQVPWGFVHFQKQKCLLLLLQHFQFTAQPQLIV